MCSNDSYKKHLSKITNDLQMKIKHLRNVNGHCQPTEGGCVQLSGIANKSL